MTKFTTLLRKDYYLNRKNLMMPVWITAGYYLLTAIALLIAYFKAPESIHVGFNDFGSFPDENIRYVASYLANLSLMIMPGILSLIFTIIITQGALNDDIHRNSELFHRSQPVSIWQRTLAKFTVGVGGNWVVLSGIALFNFILFGIILLAFDLFSFGTALAGILQSSLGFMKFGLIIGSICFFFSAVFKDKGFLQGVAILVGIQFLFMILNALLGWKIPLPLTFLYKLLYSDAIIKVEDSISKAEIIAQIRHNWMSLLVSWKTFFQILFSGGLFALSTWIYSLKEVK
ncbi:MAG: hypothetical protein JW996_02405 [Candidatus Cloacimonetes bacterium]|nr:hypothetical protein [Candidatus Cloacimonadota bacterium]